MARFHDFLRTRLEEGGFTTEDALASFLPLVRQVVEAHAAGQVAPLEGLNDLHVAGVQIGFEESRREPIRKNPREIARINPLRRRAVEIVGESKGTIDVGEGTSWQNLAIGDAETPVTRPLFLPGYVAWEHRVGHHDPLVDIYSLGLILASLACGLDLADRDDLQRF